MKDNCINKKNSYTFFLSIDIFSNPETCSFKGYLSITVAGSGFAPQAQAYSIIPALTIIITLSPSNNHSSRTYGHTQVGG